MKKIVYIAFCLLILQSCSDDHSENKRFTVVTIITMITDLVKNVGGDIVQVEGLMGAGVDPHLYKASEGDVLKLSNADMVMYNGLHLEGKLEDVFERMKSRSEEHTSELQSRPHLVCRLLLEKKKKRQIT